jgi:RNA polymerase sporulation-specific sigma factor
LNKYKYIVKQKCRTYFIIGADNEDIIQEGMIGLYKAIRTFDAEKISSFKSFADICITRQIISAIRSATRRKHSPLNSYVSFDTPISDELKSKSLEDEFFLKEEALFIDGILLKNLSVYERKVFELFKDGKSYTEIADITGKTNKQTDNALQRVKRKLRNYFAL